MKVILIQDVAKIGRKHEVVNVPDGYGLNQLIPKGLAKPATKDNLKQIEQLQAEKGVKQGALTERFFAAKKALAESTVVLKNHKNDKGHLFAAIKPEEIVVALSGQGIVVEKSMIKIATPIKTTGEHEVELIQGENHTTFKINVG